MMNTFDLFQQFPDEQSCVEYVEKLRWKDKPVCPYCGTMRKNWDEDLTKDIIASR